MFNTTLEMTQIPSKNVSLDLSDQDLTEINLNFVETIPFFNDSNMASVEFVDPYDSIWLKLITVFVYAVELMSSAIMLAFIIYERQYGHYRTLINQLLSYLYGVVSMYFLGLKIQDIFKSILKVIHISNYFF